MPNGIAYLMLLIWPLVCLVLVRTRPREEALIWSIVGGYLLLPPLAEFNLPLVPAMDKSSIPSLSILLILAFATGDRLRLWPEALGARLLVAGLVLSAVPTVLTNGEPITFEVLRGADPIVFLVDQLPGQSLRDVGSVLIAQLLALVPFLLARQYLASDAGLRALLVALVVAALAYSIPALIEVRLSPQMNVWIYGFFQHSFEQMMREGGFRPIVFLPHALWLALFVATALIGAAALARQAAPENRFKAYLVVAYLAMVLWLCKSLASQAYALLLVPMVVLAPVRWQVRLAVLFAVLAVGYPMLRNFQLVPLEAILAQAEAVSEARAQSLGYRFNNEEQLLARAAEKPLFGWGGWGRSLIRDLETGQILSIPDGRWIIVFGTFGWLGYLCEFGLLALPLVLIGWALRRHGEAAVSPLAAALCLILGITMMDMLLNATLTPVTWLVAGALLGHAERLLPRRAAAARPGAARAVMQGAGAGEGPGGRRTVL